MPQVANRARGTTDEWVPTVPARPVVLPIPHPAGWAVDEFGLPDYDHAPDAVLFDRLADRTDIVALGALYTRHAPRLYAMLERIGFDDDHARATLCELFVDLWRRHTGNHDQPPSSDGSVEAVTLQAVLRRRSAAREIDPPTESSVHRALRALGGQDLPDPPPDVRRRLMTRLGHPAVDREATQPGRSVPPVVYLAALSVMALATWWLMR